MSPQSAPADDGWRALFRPEHIPALAVLAGGVLLTSMNVLMLSTVLPSIVGEMGGAVMMAWPTSAYLSSSIIAATCTGLITVRWGARATFTAGTLIFGLGALGVAMAPTMGWVVASRFVQGFGGGMLAAVPYILVRNTYPERQWARAIGLLSSMWTVSILVGPMAGGAFAELGSWRWAFYTVTAIGLVLGLVALRVLPRAKPAEPTAKPAGIPGLRVALIVVAIALLSSAAVVAVPLGKAALIAASIAALVVTLRLDRRAAASLLPSDAFSWTTPTGTGLWLALLLSVAYSPLSIYVPIFLQRLHGFEPLASGYAVAGASMGWTLAAILVAGAAGLWANRLLVGGPLIMAVSLAAVGWLTPTPHLILLCVAITVVGIGIGLPWSFMAERTMRGARAGDEAVAASSVATVQQTGFAMGGALAGLAANSAGLTSGLERDGIVSAAFWTPVVFVVPALAATVAGLRLVAAGRSTETVPGRLSR
jgi:MFS family permease